MLGTDFEPIFSVLEISDTQSCQRSRINANSARALILTKEWGFQSIVDEGYFNL